MIESAGCEARKSPAYMHPAPFRGEATPSLQSLNRSGDMKDSVPARRASNAKVTGHNPGKSPLKPVTPEMAFWESRPVHLHIRQFARARYVSPWAVLGCVVARVVCAV